jgi:hypothetical protein
VIVGLALICLKEYIVMNTPLDANGEPMNPPAEGAGPQAGAGAGAEVDPEVIRQQRRAAAAAALVRAQAQLQVQAQAQAGVVNPIVGGLGAGVGDGVLDRDELRNRLAARRVLQAQLLQLRREQQRQQQQQQGQQPQQLVEELQRVQDGLLQQPLQFEEEDVPLLRRRSVRVAMNASRSGGSLESASGSTDDSNDDNLVPSQPFRNESAEEARFSFRNSSESDTINESASLKFKDNLEIFRKEFEGEVTQPLSSSSHSFSTAAFQSMAPEYSASTFQTESSISDYKGKGKATAAEDDIYDNNKEKPEASSGPAFSFGGEDLKGKGKEKVLTRPPSSLDINERVEKGVAALASLSAESDYEVSPLKDTSDASGALPTDSRASGLSRSSTSTTSSAANSQQQAPQPMSALFGRRGSQEQIQGVGMFAGVGPANIPPIQDQPLPPPPMPHVFQPPQQPPQFQLGANAPPVALEGFPPLQQPPVFLPAAAAAGAPRPPPPMVIPNIEQQQQAALNNLDGQAQNDINAFLELVGIQGPLDILAQNTVMVILVITLFIGAGVWLPYVTGKGLLWLVRDLYTPVVTSLTSHTVQVLQAVSDPILDPVVDGLIALATLVASGLGYGGAAGAGTAAFENEGTEAAGVKVEGLKDVKDIPSAVAMKDDAHVEPSIRKVEDILGDGVAESVVTVNYVGIANETEGSLGSIEKALNWTAQSENAPETESVDLSKEATAINSTNVTSENVTSKAGQGEEDDEDSSLILGIPEKLFCIMLGYITHMFILYHHAVSMVLMYGSDAITTN